MRAKTDLLERIASGRTDLLVEVLGRPDAGEILAEGPVSALSWCVYYGDVTALRAVEAAQGSAGLGLGALDLDRELGHAAFCGHWTMCDFLLEKGASARFALHETGETALHSALAKAGRPAFTRIVRLLLERGADPNAATIAGRETGAFMRDVRTRGETPLHRAAAFGDLEAIERLIAAGGDKTRKDAFGDTPLSYASWHLRPGRILAALAFGPHRISERAAERLTTDHGAGWGYGMERNMLGEYAPLSAPVSEDFDPENYGAGGERIPPA